MQLQAAQFRQSCSHRNTLHGACVEPCVVACPVVRAPAPARDSGRPARDLSAKSSKATSLNYDDLRHALPRANPEKRVMEEINHREVVEKCADIKALRKLDEALRERYDRQPYLAMTMVVRASELVDMESASEAQRREVTRLMDSSLAPFIAKKGIFAYRPSVLPTLLGALAALQYSHPKLNEALMKLFEAGVETERLEQLASSLCSATQLGVRLGPDLLEKVGGRVSFLMRHASSDVVGNLATSLAAYKKLPASMGRPFLVRLAEKAQESLSGLSGEQLVDLLLVFVRQDFTPSSSWVSAYQAALLANLPGLTQPRSYSSLLFSLAKGSLAITEDFLEALLQRLARPASATSSGSRSRQQQQQQPSLLADMRPASLAVVASVLSIYGYTPPADWAAKYVSAVAARAGEMEAQQVVTVIDSSLELGIPLSPDLLDELLAVAEAGLEGLPGPRLLQLVAALGGSEYRPDGPWLRKLQSALLAKAARSPPAELPDLVSVMPYLPYAYPADGDAAAAVLKAVKARADELKGLDAATRGSIQQALMQMGQTGAVAFANTLAPPAPPPPPPPPPPAAPARAPADVAPPAAKAAPAGKAAAAPAAPAAAAPRAAAAAPAGTAAGRAAATAAGASARPTAAAPPPPPPPPPSQPAMVGSSRATRRRGAASYDEDEDEYDEEEEDAYNRPAARRAAPSAPPPAMVASSRGDRRRGGSRSLYDDDDEEEDEEYDRPRSAASRRAPPPPPPPPPASAPSGVVGSSRADRRRMPASRFDDDEEEEEEEEYDDEYDERDRYGSSRRPAPSRGAPPPPPPPSSQRSGGGDGGFVGSTKARRR